MTPTRSAAHLAFVCTLPCCVCGRTRGVEAAHAPGLRGMGQKRSDLETLPMCRAHHEEQHRIGWPRFIQTYELDIPGILAELREKPRLVIIPSKCVIGAPCWFALYRGQEFLLQPVAFG